LTRMPDHGLSGGWVDLEHDARLVVVHKLVLLKGDLLRDGPDRLPREEAEDSAAFADCSASSTSLCVLLTYCHVTKAKTAVAKKSAHVATMSIAAHPLTP